MTDVSALGLRHGRGVGKHFSSESSFLACGLEVATLCSLKPLFLSFLSGIPCVPPSKPEAASTSLVKPLYVLYSVLILNFVPTFIFALLISLSALHRRKVPTLNMTSVELL